MGSAPFFAAAKKSVVFAQDAGGIFCNYYVVRHNVGIPLLPPSPMLLPMALPTERSASRKQRGILS